MMLNRFGEHWKIRATIGAALLVWAVVATTGCSYDGQLGEVACDGDVDCPDDTYCEQGYCVFGDTDPIDAGIDTSDIDPDECPDEQTECNGECVDTDTDPDHCGECDQACPSIEASTRVCVDGQCDYSCDVAGEDVRICAEYDACIDVATDPDHCGECGDACPDDRDDASPSCEAGDCGYDCDETDFEYCEDDCIDVRDNKDHCGECGNACTFDDPDGDAFCQDGTCQRFCEDTDKQPCDDSCVDTDSNVDYCGSCDNSCEIDQFCNDGSCEDTPPCQPEVPDIPFGGGEGTEEVPFTICTIEHLQNIDPDTESQDEAEETHLDAHFIMRDDLVFDEASFDRTIGSDGEQRAPFSGRFDGNGHVIEGLTIDMESQVGLFGVVDENATIIDLVLEDVDITADNGIPHEVGSLVGRNEGTIKDVTITGDVVAHSPDGDTSYSIGGVVGSNTGEITGAIVDDIYVHGDGEVGGITGTNTGIIDDVDVTGTVEAELWNFAREHFGGVAGYNGGEITNPTVEETTVLGEYFVGGIAGTSSGEIHSGVVDESTISGDEDSSDLDALDNIGGAVGSNTGTIESSTVTDTFVGPTDDTGLGENVGGLTGRNEGTVTDGSASGDIDIAGQYHIGGLAGLNRGDITESDSAGTVSPTDSSWNEALGGLVGFNEDTDNADCSISDSSSSTTVLLEENTTTGNIGGLVGTHQTDCQLDETEATGDVTGDFSVGGLVGDSAGVVLNSSAEGTVVGHEHAGGLIGHNTGTVLVSAATGDVTGNTHVGGLVGDHHGSIEQSLARGDVDTEDASYVGGLVGFQHSSGSTADSYATGDVSGYSHVGGAVGRIWRHRNTNADFDRSYSTGDVDGDSATGGFAGSQRWLTDDDNTNYCYWQNHDGNPGESAAGSLIEEDDFDDESEFDGFDFPADEDDDSYTWKMSDDEERPVLNWE